MKRSQISRRPSVRKRKADLLLDQARPLAMARDGHECQAHRAIAIPCAGRLVVHHMRLRSQGGGHDLENLLTVCDAHHRHIHANPAESKALGFIR